MGLFNILNPVFSGIITGVILLTVSQAITRIQQTQRCKGLITFLRLEIINNYRLLNEYDPNSKQPFFLEDAVWEKVNTEIIHTLPFVLTNHLIVHYYFIRNSFKVLPINFSAAELERQKSRMRFLIKRLQKYSK
jgi:hypothetical protein